MTSRPLVIPADHPAYAGHFPGRPILPAVVLLGEALAAVQAEIGAGGDWSVSQAKFTRAVSPATALTLAYEAAENGVRFEIRSPDGIVAAGAFARHADR
jgi:3-hydroxyacyl-[acyl-carrier-protein] dehydratase